MRPRGRRGSPLLGVVDRARGDLARAGGAGARAARVREVDALLLGHVEDVLVARALNGLAHLFKVVGTVKRGDGKA